MSISDLLDRVVNLPPPDPEKSATPPPELIGFFVYWVRGMRQLKKAALASMSEVSLSTIERIERGEVVSLESLDRVAIALGFDSGYFTAPRKPIAQAEAIQQLVDQFGHLQPVSVRPLTTQSQVRALGNCHSYLPYVPEEDDEQHDALNGLVEWLDFVAFMIDDTFGSTHIGSRPRKKLYADVLDYVAELRRRGWTVLVGSMSVPKPNIPEPTFPK